MPVHVAGEHHRVAHLVAPRTIGAAAAGPPVAVPGVHGVLIERPRVAVLGRHEHLLGQQVPPRSRPGQTAVEPPFLLRAEDAPVRRLPRGAADHPGVAADLVVAVLTGVEQVHGGQVAPGEAAEDRQVRAVRQRRPAQRHVLVVGTERRGPAQREVSLRGLRVEAGPVGVHLVVVEHHRPGCDGVRPLQIGVRLVLRVPPPVVRQRPGLATEAATHMEWSRVGFRGLVEVVAEMQHQVRLLLGEPAVRREPALFVVGARRHGEPGGVRKGPARAVRSGSGPPARRGPRHETGSGTRDRAGARRPRRARCAPRPGRRRRTRRGPSAGTSGHRRPATPRPPAVGACPRAHRPRAGPERAGSTAPRSWARGRRRRPPG